MKINITSIFLLILLNINYSIVFAESYEELYGDYNNSCREIHDPYEVVNRGIFKFNSTLDYFLLRPVTKIYRRVLDEDARYHIGNALDNTQVPLTTVNYALQADGHNVLLSFWQFAINSTLGIGGLEDVAGKRGLKLTPQTFGSTLGYYGVGPGPYVVLPFLGSTNSRDMFDLLILNKAMNPLNYNINHNTRNAIIVSRLVDNRSAILPYTDNISKNSLDPYVSFRSSYHQAREKKVNYPTYYRCKHVN